MRHQFCNTSKKKSSYEIRYSKTRQRNQQRADDRNYCCSCIVSLRLLRLHDVHPATSGEYEQDRKYTTRRTKSKRLHIGVFFYFKSESNLSEYASRRDKNFSPKVNFLRDGNLNF